MWYTVFACVNVSRIALSLAMVLLFPMTIVQLLLFSTVMHFCSVLLCAGFVVSLGFGFGFGFVSRGQRLLRFVSQSSSLSFVISSESCNLLFSRSRLSIINAVRYWSHVHSGWLLFCLLQQDSAIAAIIAVVSGNATLINNCFVFLSIFYSLVFM